MSRELRDFVGTRDIRDCQGSVLNYAKTTDFVQFRKSMIIKRSMSIHAPLRCSFALEDPEARSLPSWVAHICSLLSTHIYICTCLSTDFLHSCPVSGNINHEEPEHGKTKFDPRLHSLWNYF